MFLFAYQVQIYPLLHYICMYSSLDAIVDPNRNYNSIRSVGTHVSLCLLQLQLMHVSVHVYVIYIGHNLKANYAIWEGSLTQSINPQNMQTADATQNCSVTHSIFCCCCCRWSRWSRVGGACRMCLLLLFVFIHQHLLLLLLALRLQLCCGCVANKFVRGRGSQAEPTPWANDVIQPSFYGSASESGFVE